MKKVLVFILSIIILIVVLVCCSRDETTGPDNQELIVPETTEIVDTETANAEILQINDDGTIIIADDSTLADLEIGGILIADVCDAAPEGLLRKILSRNEENGNILFETEQASLAEAVQQLFLSVSYQLTPEDIRQVHLYNGNQYAPERDGIEFPVDIDCVLYDQDGNYNTTGDQIKLYGNFTFAANIFTIIEINQFNLNKFEIGIESERDVDLNLNANIQWEFDDELIFDIVEFNFTPITFMVGYVPIVITPTLRVEAHVHGDLTVTFTTGITYNEEVRYGVGYENDEWYQIKESDKSFNYNPPQFTSEFNFETGPSLRLNTLIYGVVGPYIRAKASLHFQSVLVVNPTETHFNYNLEAILYAICGIYFEVLDVTLLDEFIEFNIYTHLIGEWTIPLGGNQPPNQPSDPNPENGETDISITPTLSWTCTDPDGDPLIYDVYFGTDPTPDIGELVSSGQSSTNYDPGTLNEETTYYWKIVAKDDNNNTTDGNIWQFSTAAEGPSPSNPILVGSYDTYCAWKVFVSGSYAYIADDQEGLKILDISNPTNPQLVSSCDTYRAYGVFVSGSYAYIADTYAGLKIIDISNPSYPELVSSYDNGYAYDVFIKDSYAYIVDYNEGLDIINISNPTEPNFVSSYDCGGQIWNVFISGNFAYISQTSGLLIIDISNPFVPQFVSYYDTWVTWRVFVYDNYAFLAEGEHGISILNIIDPTNPYLVGTCDTYRAWDVFVCEDFSYIADSDEGLKIIDISNPANPQIIGSYDTSSAIDLFVSGNYVYVVDNFEELKIFQIGE